MRAKLIVEGKEFDIDIFDPELKKLVAPKKTGYERVERDEDFYCLTAAGNDVAAATEDFFVSNYYYDSANYYSSQEVAKNNIRADKLMRQLRRFAVEHRDKSLDMYTDEHALIYFDYDEEGMRIATAQEVKNFGDICFDSRATAQKAINAYRDELIWYFTGYKDSL